MAERSPNYPAVGLKDALELTRKLYKAEKRAPASAAVVVEAWGYSGVNGAARSRLSAVRKYGLVAKQGGTFKVTQRGLAMILHEEGSPEFLEAARAAALAPELFKALQTSHGEGSEMNLRNHLMLDLSFTEAGARAVGRAFRETMELAKLTDAAYDGDEEPPEVETPEPQPSALRRLIESRSRDTATTGGRVYSWPLSRGVVAEVRLTGGEVRPQHIDMLKQYLEIAKTALQTEDDPPPSASDDEQDPSE